MTFFATDIEVSGAMVLNLLIAWAIVLGLVSVCIFLGRKALDESDSPKDYYTRRYQPQYVDNAVPINLERVWGQTATVHDYGLSDNVPGVFRRQVGDSCGDIFGTSVPSHGNTLGALGQAGVHIRPPGADR